MAGGFIAGLGQALEQAGTEQQNNAFALKLQSAKLETEHQNRLDEAKASQVAEATKFERENKISDSVSGAASKMLGSSLSNLHTGDTGMVDAMLKAKIAREQSSVTSQPVNDEVGIPQYQVRHNGLGFQVGSPTPETDYSAKRAQYDKLVTYTSLMSQAHQLYSNLSVHNALGGGSLLNRLPEDLATDRATLQSVNDKLSKIEPATIEGVNRFSLELANAMRGGQLNAEHNPQVEKDLYNNAMLRSYSKIRDISTTASMPQELTDKFGGLLHDQSGNMVNAHDITVRHDNIYYAGNPSPVGNINSPFLAVHPSAAKSFAKHVAGQASAQNQNPFGDDASFNAALQSVRGQNGGK